MMLEAILYHIHNWFVVPGGVHKGEFTIENGTMNPPNVRDNQYYRIVGSVFNDGLHRHPDTNMVDEVFTGEVWAMAVPPSVVALSSDIEAWCTQHPNSAYTSESFGGYSYSRGTDPRTGTPMSWEGVFRSRLNAWRKLS